MHALKTCRFCSIWLLAFLLASCTVGPDYKAPDPSLPQGWAGMDKSVSPQPAELAFWWESLDDSILNSLIERAIANNPTVEGGKARVRQARSTLAQEKGGLLPSLSGNGSVKRSRVVDSAVAQGSDNPSNQWQSGFDASWELDLFGAKRRSAEAARYGVEASREELRNTVLVLIGDVAANYAQVRASQARILLAKRTAATQRETVTLTRARGAAGTATETEIAQAEGVAATTEAEIPSLEITRMAAIHRLGVLLGLAPSELSDQLVKQGRIPVPDKRMQVGIPADILSARPDVRRAERLLAQATAKIGVAEAARYPSISLTGNINSQALNVQDLARKSTLAWTLGPALSVPVFRGGQLKAAVDYAMAGRDEAAASYQSTILTALEDVENAIVSLNQNRLRLGRLSMAVEAYRKAEEGARKRYEAGTLDYLNLLDAQRTRYQTESARIESQLAVLQSFVSLHKALGGGWSGELNIRQNTTK